MLRLIVGAFISVAYRTAADLTELSIQEFEDMALIDGNGGGHDAG